MRKRREGEKGESTDVNVSTEVKRAFLLFQKTPPQLHFYSYFFSENAADTVKLIFFVEPWNIGGEQFFRICGISLCCDEQKPSLTSTLASHIVGLAMASDTSQIILSV